MIYLAIMLISALLISFAMGGAFAIWYTTKSVDDAIWGTSSNPNRNSPRTH